MQAPPSSLSKVPCDMFQLENSETIVIDVTGCGIDALQFSGFVLIDFIIETCMIHDKLSTSQSHFSSQQRLSRRVDAL